MSGPLLKKRFLINCVVRHIYFACDLFVLTYSVGAVSPSPRMTNGHALVSPTDVNPGLRLFASIASWLGANYDKLPTIAGKVSEFVQDILSGETEGETGIRCFGSSVLWRRP